MPAIIVAKVRGNSFDVLLHKKRGDGWTIPEAAYGADEIALRRHPQCPKFLKEQIALRAAVRTVIVAAGGGTCGTGLGVAHELHEIEGPFPGSPRVASQRFMKVDLPPGLLRMIDDPLPNCRVMSVSKNKDCFCYLIHPNREGRYAADWQPRALPQARGELDEAWNAPGTSKPGKYGYVWRPLDQLAGSMDRPVPSSNKAMVSSMHPYFAGPELHAHLTDLLTSGQKKHPAAAAGATAAAHFSAGGLALPAGLLNLLPLPTAPVPALGKPLPPLTPGPPRRCRVAGCVDCYAANPHYCRLCGDMDSTHHSYDCPESKIIYFIRHGESTANVCDPGRRADHPDPLLTPTGLQQALRLTSQSPKWCVEVVISSPLRRAMHTANLVFQGQGVTHHLNPLVREIGGAHSSGLLDHSPHHPDNRGRSGFRLRTFIDECLATHKGPYFDGPCVERLDARKDAMWQPENESAGAVTRAELDESAVAGAVDSLLCRPERVIGVVSHWTLLNRLFGVDARNCAVYRVTVHPKSKQRVVMMQDAWQDWTGTSFVKWDAESERLLNSAARAAAKK